MMGWSSVQLEPDQIAVLEPTNTRQWGRVAANTAPHCEPCLSEGLNEFVQQKHLSQTAVQRIINNDLDGPDGAHLKISVLERQRQMGL